ncbi:MAG: sigma-54 dependent transcriptional regulator [candidate division KSB1 bacterium]|nr:sigma-54 dependent transcriptional regulator [candidate division KSB1 bacterium]
MMAQDNKDSAIQDSSPRATILVVDDDANVRQVLVTQLKDAGFQVEEAQSGHEAKRLIDRRAYDVIICDLVMESVSGIDVLMHSKRVNSDAEVIMLTAFGSVETAVQALQSGAFHYITKPHNREELIVTVQRALEQNRLRLRLRALERQMREQFGVENIVTVNPKMQQLIKTAISVAHTESNVMITGESGTGKELIAGLIHSMSRVADKPFVAVNCGGIPESLLESELFGHVKGAFTGAISTKRGLVEEADGGTLFLDEVAEMNTTLQVKLLRFIQGGEFRRVGENEVRRVKVRIIAATNKDLKQAMEMGEFREDLYYRLSVIPLHIPPLRERREDISLLAQHFLKMFATRLDKPVRQFSKDALNALMQYHWPGNVRELMNAIEHGVALSSGDTLELKDLPPNIAHPMTEEGMPLAESRGTLEDIEKSYILKVLQETGWNQKQACRILGLSKATLYRRLKKYGIRAKLMTASLSS